MCNNILYRNNRHTTLVGQNEKQIDNSLLHIYIIVFILSGVIYVEKSSDYIAMSLAQQIVTAAVAVPYVIFFR